jgi:hypothetical protein
MLAKKRFLRQIFVLPAVFSLLLGVIVVSPIHKSFLANPQSVKSSNTFHKAQAVPAEEFITPSRAALSGYHAKKEKQSSHDKNLSFSRSIEPTVYMSGIVLFKFANSAGLFRPNVPSNKAPPRP